MIIEKKREKIKNIISGGVGDEPYFKLPAVPTKIELIHALNYYSKSCSTKESKDYIVVFLENYDKKLQLQVKKISDKWFSNIGFVLRLKERNYILSDDVILSTIEKVQRIVDERSVSDEYEHSDTIKSNEISYKNNRNEILYLLDDCVENALKNEKNDITHIVGTTKELKEAKIEAVSKLHELEENFENCYSKNIVKILIPVYQMFIKIIDKHLTATKKIKTKPRIQKPIPIHLKETVGKRFVVFKDKYNKYIIFRSSASLLGVENEIIVNCKSRLTFTKCKKGFVEKLKSCTTINEAQNLIKDFAGNIIVDETDKNKKVSNKFEIVLTLK
ncbi:MAG: hypothetical protein PHC28_11740 [Flavobacterium sp.]|uniref:hypothetical protein n=1 Tax=Flavobacterium sp. TaxID=239 RepID=UPI002622420F|nr:hypothetical protein [Flavobacterium sp.]MDD5151125.1 hypothetical protein [Flavobacterium sp.]